VFRVIPLIALVLIAACSRGPTKGTTAPPADTRAVTPPASPGGTAPPAGSAPAEAVKPLPEKLPDILARVNGETVTRKELEEYIGNLERQAGGALPTEQRDRVYRGVIDQLVGYKLLLQEANSRKVVVPEADIDARVAEVKKQFPSEDLFMQTLLERKMTVDQLKADARKDIAISKLIESEITAKVAVKPGQVEDFYAKNPDQFKQPERVRASHILIRFPENADAAAKAQAKSKAQQVLKEVKAGKDFAALAKEHSQDGSAANGGDLGFFPQGQMVGPFNDVAFKLKPGAVSDLVETAFGYHIIKVAEKQPARTVPLEEVRPRVEQYLQNQNRETETESYVKSLRAKGKVQILI
jgi:peptidyl-prolyl cis-trans isomerase C